jgi:hypothetical protein
MLVKIVFSLEGMVADLAGEERALSMGSLIASFCGLVG